jgi:hypothetical protein
MSLSVYHRISPSEGWDLQCLPTFVPGNDTSFEELRVEAMKAIRAHNFETYVSVDVRRNIKIHFELSW